MIRSSNTFICQLTQAEQDAIEAELRQYFEWLGATYSGTYASISDAMSGRLWMVEDVVDIWPYLHPGEERLTPEWSHGSLSCIQCVSFTDDGREYDTEDIPAVEASRQINVYAHSRGYTTLYNDDGTVLGFHDDVYGGRWEYWDCDERTYYEINGLWHQ